MEIALLQTIIHWEDKEQNLQHFSDIINKVKVPVDVFVLPEMFTTGFTMNAEPFAEKLGELTTKWMLQKAAEKNACLVGSFITTDGIQNYNTLLWAYPDGTYKTYHKRHLFRMAGEHQHYAAGTEKIICEYKGFKFLPLICYDLRFPVWSRNKIGTSEEYDILLYVANWPKVRINAWTKLLQARAIENLSFVIGLNRIGFDGYEKAYNGQSMVIDYKGDIISSCNHFNTTIIVKLDKSKLDYFREKFPAHLDADEFEIKI
ncbi:MAG: amidohydrolase [Bacteroidia bacterium]